MSEYIKHSPYFRQAIRETVALVALSPLFYLTIKAAFLLGTTGSVAGVLAVIL